MNHQPEVYTNPRRHPQSNGETQRLCGRSGSRAPETKCARNRAYVQGPGRRNAYVERQCPQGRKNGETEDQRAALESNAVSRSCTSLWSVSREARNGQDWALGFALRHLHGELPDKRLVATSEVP